ncbi:MAG: bifunctional riboflavin kinase/FAD synthetase [Acidobacteriia bacterium]|nr:bifunctional riboflavin kinase/FAD synthetase [Terriglobia bacterium]
MKVFTQLAEIPSGLHHPIVTIGNFDGVHRGHQEIIRQVVSKARASNGCSVLVTFEPHPLAVLTPQAPPRLIMTRDQKLEAFASYGMDMTVFVRFDADFAQWSPRRFVETVLVDAIGAKSVYVGSNFVFGYQQQGTVETLVALGKECGFNVVSIPQFTWRRRRVSSSLIRNLLLEGHIETSNRLLGHFYTLQGRVVPGAGRGRQLEFPTLNLLPENDLIPKPGVYITRAKIDSTIFPSVTNIGVRPTFGENQRIIEAHLIDVTLSTAPHHLSLSLLHRLRNEVKFPSREDLQKQIFEDVRSARRFFNRLTRFNQDSGGGN